MTYFSQTLYKNHSGKIGSWTVEVLDGTDEAMLRISHTKVLGGKVAVNFDSVKGKNIGRANETTPLQQAVLEAESRVRKQLDKGYVETIEAAGQPVTNSLGKKKPMLALDLGKVKPEEIDWDNAYWQPKLDGHRCLNDGVIYSRNGKEIDCAHISEALAAAGLKDVLLDGELYAHGVSLQQIGSLIKKPQLGSEQLVYHIYDLISDEPFWRRQMAMDSLLAAPVAGLLRVPTIRVWDMKRALELTDQAIADGYEGGILRHGTAGYEDDKRSKSLLKLKKFSDMEVTVTGYRLGTPKVINGITLQQPVVSYVTDDGKEAEVLIHGNAHEKHLEVDGLENGSSIGRRLTIKHFGFTNKGVPNIATAKCWYEPL